MEASPVHPGEKKCAGCHGINNKCAAPSVLRLTDVLGWLAGWPLDRRHHHYTSFSHQLYHNTLTPFTCHPLLPSSTTVSLTPFISPLTY
ncbi:hypothetical protein E2C01_036360 [Portunus trituberculatus]|uniref:Uncharacterized protein n=1 Tax=Portunus trituberculatus TaxID=210409 RepID=A0A5B7F6I6_PORTR|nr:hypothetical protein [Portunus trituberculatus]